MSLDANFLKVDGQKIVNRRGEEIRLRGFCLGGWMNMESFITGYPSNESGQRRAVEQVLGKELGERFFESFLDHFFSRADLQFIKDLGCNVVRVALNYRHFESDEKPFDYKRANFKFLDRIIQWAQELGIYIILDLHSVQGWQNRGWHCDNPGREAAFWGQKQFEDRAVALWEHLVDRYRERPYIAGYNLMNEPDAVDVSLLNRYHERATAAIRKIDPDHIIFLDANKYAKNFQGMSPPFTDNLVYSYHPYAEPVLTQKTYPCRLGEQIYDKRWLEQLLAGYSEFMRRYNVPAWAGEFGCHYPPGGDAEYCASLMRDQIELFEQLGHHWTIWTYKDIGIMGVVTVKPGSPWMERTKRVREVKSSLRCDFWAERQPVPLDNLMAQVVSHVRSAAGDLPGAWESLDWGIYGAVCEALLSQMLLPAFAEQFRGIDGIQIETLMESFDFHNCQIHEPVAAVIRETTGV